MWCYAVIAYGCAECPKLSCGRDGCDTEFCYHCRQLWHPDQTCDQARRQRARHTSGGHDGSTLCNRMNCTVCACQFCWLCMQEITDVHYLSPSGCTFWGKKPWSQTRKVLWQVGMLLGAPVVISLIAGIAIPVIIVGIPIYMGRKVHGRCKKNNISGIPMSLCRNGWCRPQGEPPDSHKIQLEDLASFSDHWTGQSNSAKSGGGHATVLQEVKVSVQEVGVLPSTSAAPPEVSVCAGLEEASESPGYTQQDSQSDCELVIVPDGKLHDTQAFSLRDGTSIKVRVEIETHPRGARQTSLSSVLSTRSLSVESLGLSRPQSQSQDYLCASEPPDKRGGGGGGRGGGRGRSGSGGGGDDKMEAAAEAEGTFCPVFEFDGV
ncbi:hypothetical protein CRUP_016811 [Coryphaenoides rupestris]|nr:hypothetical protein CRUP_016811 [Coryphaenoides rupestris]